MAERVPRLRPGVDIRKFKLDPMDGFLITRIDGKLGSKELARETGLPDFSVARALEKLEQLGVIELIDPNALPPRLPAEPTSAVAQFDDLVPKYDPKELDEPVDLTREQRKRILDIYYRLDDLDHYTLLGIRRDVDKKTIKRSYFELAAVLHPDRYYKKELGSFKAKMEVLFARVTEAHDTLVDRARRAEYDAYLAEVSPTRGMEAILERAMAESARSTVSPQGTTPPRASVPAEPNPAESQRARQPTAEEIQLRKEALARRLSGVPRAPQASRPPADILNPHGYASTQDAMDALKRRYDNRLESATQAQAKRYVTAAEDALAKNDLVAASTALNLATKFAPDDEALAMRAQEVRDLAEKVLCETYLKQAEHEERQGHWAEAAKSWLKLAKAKDDARSHERAAHALLRSDDGDLHEAAEHAKRAITIQPDRVEHHIVLVEVYLKAGLAVSARRAAEAANQLDPKHPGLQALLKRIG